jgi:DNA-directed RNA polymerase sigma subunit (sigma70/sigma32)
MVLARKALDTYDPKRGAKLSTHVANQVMPVHRLVYRYTNVGKIPEDRIRMVRTYQETIESLRDELNRRPSDAEIADRMNLPVKKVGLLRREAWRDVVDSGFMASLHPFVESDKAGDMLDFVYHDLGPRERVVFEHVVGYNGRKPAKSMQQVANLSGVPLTEVRKIKRSIATKIEGMR